jgi:hypothetical protein
MPLSRQAAAALRTTPEITLGLNPSVQVSPVLINNGSGDGAGLYSGSQGRSLSAFADLLSGYPLPKR